MNLIQVIDIETGKTLILSTPIVGGDSSSLDPVVPSNDGFEYYESVTNGVKSWQKVIYVSGTSAANKLKLQAGASGDWVTGHYVGTTSGVTVGTKGGEIFYGVDATSSINYRYEAIADDYWYRTSSNV